MRGKFEIIRNLAAAHGGLATASQLAKAGIRGGHTGFYLKTGRIIRANRGVYALPEAFEDEFAVLQSRYGKGVFFCGTALFLHGLSDRTPDRFRMAFPASYNTSRLPPEIVASRLSPVFYGTGIAEVKTPGGHPVAAYDAEKTLCDILRPVNHVPKDEAAAAFKAYVRRGRADIRKLSEYAVRLRVSSFVRSYLEVLL
jgi:hypothetical protein